MRVRHLVLTRSFAGVERHVCVLANEQAKRGDDVEVWGGLPPEMRRHLDRRVVHRPAVALAPTALRSLRASRPDVVHAHMTKAELAAIAPAVVDGAPLVATRHFARRRGTGVGGMLTRPVIARRVDAQIAVSRYVAEAVEGPSTVVYPGVEIDPAPQAAPRRPVALVVQRLQPEKNTEVAVRAFAAGAPPDWTLEIVGSGPEAARLRGLVARLDIDDRVSFLGFRDDVPRLMGSSAVLLAPCEVEGLGLSVLEAMSHALPVLASRAGAHLETVGLAADAQLFAPGDAEHAAVLLARLGAEAALREAYGAQLADVQRTTFTPQAQAEATEAVYHEVLA